MGLFNKLKEPIFLKESSNAKEQLNFLNNLLEVAPEDIKQEIEKEKKIVSYGILGEENIVFELKNSHMPMYVLHDIVLESDALKAQIDFLVITKKCIFIIECKNLVGNIEINSKGDFIRTYNYNGKYMKEGIYSPITQNTRHTEIIKKLRLNSKSNIISKNIFEKNFYDTYKSVVVLSNPKTILDDKYAKSEIKEQVIKADKLIYYIKKTNEASNSANIPEKSMEEVANFFLELNVNKTVSFEEKYRNYLNNIDTVDNKRNQKEIENNIETVNKVKEAKEDYILNNIENPVMETPVFKELKKFRLEKSRKENIKAYFICSDKQLEELIIKNPKNLDELKQVSGFGDVKCNKYGTDIINILEKYRC